MRAALERGCVHAAAACDVCPCPRSQIRNLGGLPICRRRTDAGGTGARPLENRTRSDYERVINAYRRVYLGAPTSGRADPSVVAAAQMTEEMGRRFNDPDICVRPSSSTNFFAASIPAASSASTRCSGLAKSIRTTCTTRLAPTRPSRNSCGAIPATSSPSRQQALAEPAQPQANLRARARTRLRQGLQTPGQARIRQDSDQDNDAAAVVPDSTKDNASEANSAPPRPTESPRESSESVTGRRQTTRGLRSIWNRA